MHSCLQIHEVLRSIFSAVNKYRDITLDVQQPFRGADVGRQTLACLARTCRAFSEPALDVLWAHIDTLGPVVACLPRHVWSRHRGSLRTGGGCILITHWWGIEKYLVRVRALGNSGRRVTADMSTELVHALCGHPWPFLLPRLQKLMWTDGSYESTHLFCKLLSPTLTDFHLHAKGNLLMLSVLSSLGAICPLMKSFSTTGLDSAASVPVSAAVVCGWHQLKTFSTEAVDGPALLHLFSLPSLEFLELSFLSSNRGSFNYSPTTFSTSLHHLTIRAQDPESCLPFLEATWIGARSLTISLGNIPRSSSNETLLSLLASRVTAQQVQALTLDLTCDSLLTITEITPLFPFCALEELTLPSTYGNLTINDHDLTRAVKSWPKLTKLRLGDEATWSTPARPQRPQITLDGIVSLLLHCPDLCALGIAMDATSYNVVTPEVPGGGVTNTKITTLSVGVSLIENPLAVATFLASILPNLENILCKDDSDIVPYQKESRHTKWARASMYLRDVQMIKKQERARVGNCSCSQVCN
ncbi:hypothetical protein DEU56DRAFT_234738 [Suillus clintonianus]|uniref:uncharacterized protein n=1 Tax=Suillus clintonianus TaxID=1904413 RepID=UPI001B87B0B4|nr:uncharacterized protein DEU56DRAFT_234738 [Suillus clintonianus]KAG2156422.1 hypothetical protein DEU56DRAFT_234738 [Suillus clintonianus]